MKNYILRVLFGIVVTFSAAFSLILAYFALRTEHYFFALMFSVIAVIISYAIRYFEAKK